jgi:hypothetical protein
MQDKLPSDPHIAALRASEHARRPALGRGAGTAGRRRSASAAPEYREHAHHIFGLALLQCGGDSIGRSTSSRRATARRRAIASLDELLEVIKPLRDDKDPCSPLGRLRAAIVEADACLLRDDLPGARAAIDRRIVWQSGEVQSLARLAEVELRAEPDRAIRRFRKALALGAIPRREPDVQIA